MDLLVMSVGKVLGQRKCLFQDSESVGAELPNRLHSLPQLLHLIPDDGHVFGWLGFA